jgi:hypothetical protein
MEPAQFKAILPVGAVLTGDDVSAYLQDWWGSRNLPSQSGIQRILSEN